MECEIKERAGRFVEDTIDIHLQEIKVTDEAYKVVLQDFEEIVNDAKAVMEQLDKKQRKLLLDYDERKHIVEQEKGRCLYLAGVKDGVRLAKYLEIND